MEKMPVVMHFGWMKKSVKGLYLGAIILLAMLAVFGLVAGIKVMSANASAVKVGLIVEGDLSENGFNHMSMDGLVKAESELGVVGTVYTSTDPSGIEANVLQCTADGNDLCIGGGFATGEAISKTAILSPTIKFAVVDTTFVNYPPNLRGIAFSSEEVGYLAGTLAGSMSKSGIIGDLGGMEIPPVTAFTEAYSNAAQCASPGITTIISYTNSFSDSVLGAEYAQAMIANGADVIFAAAGPSGDGAILTATQSGIWAIGVDTDQYLTLFMSGTVPGSNLLLTSAMKRVENAVFMTISDVVSGTFTSGTFIYNLASNGVGLAPFHEAEESIPAGVQTWLGWISRAIIGGTIKPLDPSGACLIKHQQFLPLTSR